MLRNLRRVFLFLGSVFDGLDLELQLDHLCTTKIRPTIPTAMADVACSSYLLLPARALLVE